MTATVPTQSSNFDFLRAVDPVLAEKGAAAEQALDDDNLHYALICLGQLTDTLARRIASEKGIRFTKLTHFNVLDNLSRLGYLKHASKWHRIRIARNKAMHEVGYKPSFNGVFSLLQDAYTLCATHYKYTVPFQWRPPTVATVVTEVPEPLSTPDVEPVSAAPVSGETEPLPVEAQPDEQTVQAPAQGWGSIAIGAFVCTLLGGMLHNVWTADYLWAHVAAPYNVLVLFYYHLMVSLYSGVVYGSGLIANAELHPWFEKLLVLGAVVTGAVALYKWRFTVNEIKAYIPTLFWAPFWVGFGWLVVSTSAWVILNLLRPVQWLLNWLLASPVAG